MKLLWLGKLASCFREHYGIIAVERMNAAYLEISKQGLDPNLTGENPHKPAPNGAKQGETMKIIIVNGKQYLAESIDKKDDTLILKAAMEVSIPGSLTPSIVANWLKQANMDALGDVTMVGALNSYQLREITPAEQIIIDHQAHLLDYAKTIAVPTLENQVYDTVQ